MSNKFNTIIEENLRRYQQNTLIVNDRVKFVDNFFQHEWTKSQPVLKIERLKALIESGNNIRVSAVKTSRPQTAESGHFEIVDDVYYDVVEEIFSLTFAAEDELENLLCGQQLGMTGLFSHLLGYHFNFP